MNELRTKGTDSAAGDDALDRLMAEANPVADDEFAAEHLVESFDRLEQQIVTSPRSRRRGRPRRRGGIVVVLAAASLITSAALGGMYTTHTGFFPSKAGTENDTSEFLDTGAPDFPPLVRKFVKDIPFPPGDSAVSRIPRYLAQFKALKARDHGVGTVVQAAGITGQFSFQAICAWRGYFLYVHAKGDVAKQAMAADRLAQVASSGFEKKVDSFWPVYLAAAKREAAGDPTTSAKFAIFYKVNCTGLPQPWAGK